jgi:hypothetical protein
MLWQASLGSYQAGVAFNFGSCQRWVVGFSCLPGAPDQLRITVNAGPLDGPASIFDDIRLSFYDTPTLFPLEVDAPNVAAGCLGPGGSVKVKITSDTASDRLRRGLTVI